MRRAVELVAELVRERGDRRPHPDGRGARRSHAADRHRRPGVRRRQRGRSRRRGPAVRPPRQAAGDGRLARRARPVDPGRRRRAAVRPGRRRRRLCRVRLAAGDRGGAAPRACPTPAASCSSRPARRAAASTCPPTSRRSQDRIGTPSLVVCLDSGCLDYQRLWFTTSLRGLVGGTLARRHPPRGRALGRGQRRRAVVVPHRPPAARPYRGLGDRARPAARAARRDPRRPPPPGGRDRRRVPHRRRLPVRRRRRGR